jgi:hypothetical protein
MSTSVAYNNVLSTHVDEESERGRKSFVQHGPVGGVQIVLIDVFSERKYVLGFLLDSVVVRHLVSNSGQEVVHQ